MSLSTQFLDADGTTQQWPQPAVVKDQFPVIAKNPETTWKQLLGNFPATPDAPRNEKHNGLAKVCAPDAEIDGQPCVTSERCRCTQTIPQQGATARKQSRRATRLTKARKFPAQWSRQKLEPLQVWRHKEERQKTNFDKTLGRHRGESTPQVPFGPGDHRAASREANFVSRHPKWTGLAIHYSTPAAETRLRVQQRSTRQCPGTDSCWKAMLQAQPWRALGVRCYTK
mmetsp:Transcript_63912/g.151169  ORF Transcript_63912/g.151169 Transcript_63912/m.151169 type:complete len:227 (-) Transcript_63912:99-779(-)